MKSTWVSTSQRTVPPIASGDELEARIRPEPAADLCRRSTVGHDDIRGEIGRAADQRRAYPVGVDGHAAARGNPSVGNRSHAAAAPPRRLRVRRYADVDAHHRAGDVRGVAVTGLYAMVVVTSGHEDDRFAVRRLHDLDDVRRDARAPRQ